MKIAKALVYVAVILVVAVIASAQTSSVESRITQPIDESNRVVLRGNVYPMARPEFDRGLAPANLPLEHRWLVLKRSTAQEAALETLMAQQQDKTSPNYHKWLTPAEFGLQYGPSAQDIQTVVRWLTSHGIGVSQVTNGRMELEFSGTAAEIQQAFHTEIHMYNVNGEQHYANATDPEIPSALASVVAGVAALHDFKPRPHGHRIALTANGTPIRRANPNFTYPTSCTPTGSNATCNFTLGPADFNTIYNVPSSATGSGQTIVILGQATIQTTDITDFRTVFNVTPTTSLPTIVSPAGDPPPSLSLSDQSGDEGESDLDLEWSGSIAPSASQIFVTSSNVIDSATYAVQNNVAPIIGLSYGVCEPSAGVSGNAEFNAIWQQAAAQGQTVVVSTGDTGSASCENPTSTPWLATTGLSVSGLASTVYNLAVGGTDFNDLTNPTTYWNTSNSGSTQLSAKSYIPETTYNNSCTNAAWGQVSGLSNIPLTNCNDTSALNGNFVQYISPSGGGGGASNCVTVSGSSCSAGYAKPSWQAAPGVPNDSARDVPDVSMFAGNGFAASFYIVCEADQNNGLNNGQDVACNLSSSDFIGFGGTSASAQVMAGIMALLKQKISPSSNMGLVNPTFYELASDQASMSCNSSSPASGCVFNDVTVGNNSAPCQVGTANCGVTASGETAGILGGCDAGAGYDAVTGLGSVNVGNLLNSWSTAGANSTADFQLSLQNCNATANISNPGNSGGVGITMTAVNGFTGSYTITCSGLPSMSTCSSTQSSVDNTHTNATVTVATTASVTGNVAPNGRPAWPLQLIKLVIPLMSLAVLLFIMGRFRGWSRRWATGFATAAAVILLVAGCGGGGGSHGCTTCTGGTPTGYVSGATITVTSGSTTHTMPFNVNVE